MPPSDPRDARTDDPRYTTPGRADDRSRDPRKDGPVPGKPSAPDRSAARERDVLLRPPGSHPVGVGAGAAAGGAAGAILGSSAGPVGAVVGGALGAVAGGYIGRETAEAINPTAEDRYWAEAYRLRPYVVAGEMYESYRPAYHFGWEAYRRRADSAGASPGEVPSFEELAPVLAAQWTATDASATLPWERARPAARDAWNRVAAAGLESEIGAVDGLYETCLDSAQGFHTAADGLIDPAYADLIESWAVQREALADELATLLARMGAEPSPRAGRDPAERRLWLSVRDATGRGRRAVLTECERSEDYVVKEYESALTRSLPAGVEAVLQRHQTVVSVTHDQVRSLRDAAPD